MIVIVEEEVREVSGAMGTGAIGTSIGPFAGEGLDEAFGFAIGLGPVGFGEEMGEAKRVAGAGEVLGAIGGTAIGEERADCDAMSGVELKGLLQGRDDTGDAFVWEQAGEGETRVIIDGDVEELEAGAGIADGAIAGGADARTAEAAQFLDIEVKQIAWPSAFVTVNRGFGIEGAEPVEAMAAQDPGDGRLGDAEHGEDLGVGAALSTQPEDASDEPGVGLARLAPRDAGAIVEAGGEVGLDGALQPAAQSTIGDVKSGGNGASREVLRNELSDHFGSHERSESGISVHVVRTAWRWVENGSTTSLRARSRADNVLKHDT